MTKKIYWANALFSEADWEFNVMAAKRIREEGYDVFLAQEAFSKDADPTNEEIFRIDTGELKTCDIVVACIDQFPIDTGVACEIGVAYGLGIPVVGLYTDIRAMREGQGRMYKNQYVLGAIEVNGEIVHSLDDVFKVLPKYLK
ncbi:MAG: nucleoside 2-deoxyribosyltransferase [Candidatus Thorarchaeota archaeon]